MVNIPIDVRVSSIGKQTRDNNYPVHSPGTTGTQTSYNTQGCNHRAAQTKSPSREADLLGRLRLNEERVGDDLTSRTMVIMTTG